MAPEVDFWALHVCAYMFMCLFTYVYIHPNVHIYICQKSFFKAFLMLSRSGGYSRRLVLL